MDSVRKNCAAVNDSDRRHRRVAPKQLPESPGDLREQLYNGGEIGTLTEVQLSEPEITSMRGIMLDLDPKLLRLGVVTKAMRENPKEFYEQVVSTWLSRHPVLDKAEVRNSGTGLHAILRFDEPLEIETEGERLRWAGMVKAIQRLLPTDPHCPGITALTRPVGGVNAKNGAKVRRLRKGQPVTAEEVTALFDRVRTSPFRTIATILLGIERIAPCPVCDGEGSRLDALDHVGMCYNGCGEVRLGQLYDAFMKPRPKREG